MNNKQIIIDSGLTLEHHYEIQYSNIYLSQFLNKYVIYSLFATYNKVKRFQIIIELISDLKKVRLFVFGRTKHSFSAVLFRFIEIHIF